MQHANAPLTSTGRLRMVQLVEEDGLTFEAAATASNVAKSTVHLWVTRWRQASEEGRHARLPRGSLVAAAQEPEPAADRGGRADLRAAAANRLEPASARRRARYPEAALDRPPGAAPRRHPAVVRYEWPCPGQLLHMDVKKLGRFEAPGHVLTADRTKRTRGAGWEYVHSIVDDCSRLAYRRSTQTSAPNGHRVHRARARLVPRPRHRA